MQYHVPKPREPCSLEPAETSAPDTGCPCPSGAGGHTHASVFIHATHPQTAKIKKRRLSLHQKQARRFLFNQL